MAYVDILDSEIDVDSPINTALMEKYRNNDRALRTCLVPVVFAEASTTSGTYTLLASYRIFVPDLVDYVGIQRKLYAEFRVKTTAGTATYKVRDASHAVDSNEVTTTSTLYESKVCTLNLSAATAGGFWTIEVYGKTTAGTCYVICNASITSRMDY